MIRGITLRGAVALNVITMIGIGPLITIPLVLAQLAGPLALVGWVAGALVALCDGLVWAELGSRYPVSGGTYVYLREIFGAQRWGRLLAFLYNWQFFLGISLTLSTGYIGFANYAGYLFPQIAQNATLTHAVAVGIGAITIALLYRRVTAAAALGSALAVAAIATLLIVGIAGFSHADFHRAFTMSAPVSFGWGFLAGLGGALYITLYDYAGYSQAALVGEELIEPRRTLPRAVVMSILIVLALYVFLQLGVLGAIPWQTLVGAHGNPAAGSQYVASTVVANAWGVAAARVVTVLILITAFASVYGGLLASSRVPFAAARDGAFLPAFARLHPTKQFPHVSLLAMGALSLAACFFDLGFVIAVIGTAGILIGAVGQIVALFVFRARGERAPFRMWLFPLPALIALAGWILAFANTGTLAIELGVGWLLIGIVAYMLTARAQRAWPFAAVAAALAFFFVPTPARAAQPPLFVYGAAFFYERIPHEQWAPALAQYRRMGINTIDLYVMWNWHELRDGDFDFTGRTNPRRDLKGLLALMHRDGFKVVLRPGPVIRNEWRNGGYPAWLLERPEYRMPLRDVLEGRYPATATLQNAHSDAAAQEWLTNATHMRYATRWLNEVFDVAAPWKSDILAVALDDDQGAYIDNDTWPAPHFHAYVGKLASIVHHSAMGGAMPVFINTYQMKVTASAPVWTWGNWYQSDAYSIGEHDRAQLEFSTGLLQTQHPARPVMVSEFQAGWLQDADQAAPRPADPTNTTLALHTLLQMGAHGIVNFPVQDTLNPAGWEAPWTNAFYSWDAALSVQLTPQARWAPTSRFGELIAHHGAQLAQTQPAADAAVAYLTSAYDAARITNPQIAQIAQATISAQRGCRVMRVTCALLDLRYASLAQLRAFPALIVPDTGVPLPYIDSVREKLAQYRRGGGRIVRRARFAAIRRPHAGGIENAVLLADSAGRYAFLDVVNYGRTPLHTRAARVYAGRFAANVPALTVAPRDAVLLPLGEAAGKVTLRQAQGDTAVMLSLSKHDAASTLIPLRTGSHIDAPQLRDTPGVYRSDVYRDGYPAVVFQTPRARLIISPCAGARALVFEDRATGENLFTTVGGLRDAWTPQLPPSPRDYIAKYTHPIAAGTFNRCYAVSTNAAQRKATFSYDAPDAPSHGASIRKSIVMENDSQFAVSSDTEFHGYSNEQAQQLTSFAVSAGDDLIELPNAYGFYQPAHHRVIMVAWPRGAVTAQSLDRHPGDALLTLTYAAGALRTTRYGFAAATSAGEAQADLRRFANRR